MPSAKARANKAATAARIATYNAAVAALDSVTPIESDSVGAGTPIMSIPGLAPEVKDLGALNPTSALMALKPTLPSMLNLNTSPHLNRALAVGAVTTSAGHNNNASDEENVQPPMMVAAAPPAPAQAIEGKGPNGAGYTSRPLSPILGNIDNEKDVRAYEVERQKVKRAGELAKRKAKKTVRVGGGSVSAVSSGHSPSEAWGKKDSKARIGSNEMDVDIGDVPPLGRNTTVRKGPVEIQLPSGGGVEVSLSELVLHGTHKKPRKTIEDDFEMISPVRSVIILDDLLEAKDVDMDEPWEHIDRDSEAVKKTEPSYAAILVGATH